MFFFNSSLKILKHHRRTLFIASRQHRDSIPIFALQHAWLVLIATLSFFLCPFTKHSKNTTLHTWESLKLSWGDSIMSESLFMNSINIQLYKIWNRSIYVTGFVHKKALLSMKKPSKDTLQFGKPYKIWWNSPSGKYHLHVCSFLLPLVHCGELQHMGDDIFFPVWLGGTVDNFNSLSCLRSTYVVELYHLEGILVITCNVMCQLLICSIS